MHLVLLSSARQLALYCKTSTFVKSSDIVYSSFVSIGLDETLLESYSSLLEGMALDGSYSDAINLWHVTLRVLM